MNFFARHAPADPDAALARLPVIDFGPWIGGDEAALAPLAEEVCRACEDVGFFYIAGHGVAQEVIDAAFEQDRRFHALPLHARQAVAIDQNKVGYLAMNASIQRHSSVHRATRQSRDGGRLIHDI